MAVREVRADDSRKEAKTQRKPGTGLCDAWCGPLGFAVGGSALECNRGVWFMAVVLKLISRPLHRTLREHAPWSRPSGRRRAEGIMAVYSAVLANRLMPKAYRPLLRFNGPSFAAVEELLQVTFTLLADGLFDLASHRGFKGFVFYVSENTDWFRERWVSHS